MRVHEPLLCLAWLLLRVTTCSVTVHGEHRTERRSVDVQWQASVADLSVVETASLGRRPNQTTVAAEPTLRSSDSVFSPWYSKPTTIRATSADVTESLGATTATPTRTNTCRMYLAPSTIPGAGLGSFAGVAFEKGDEVTPGDVVVPISDIAYHHGGEDHVDTFLWDEYIWSGDTFNYMSEPHHDIDGASFGIGAVPNCFFPLLNVQDTHTLQRDYGTLDRTSPGVGAFTPWHDRRSHATRPIQAGAELFVDYGYNYFKGDRVDVFGWIPFLPDFKKADALLEKYTATVQSLVRTAWKQCLMRTDDATERKATCQRHLIAELPPFVAFSHDLYEAAKRIMSVWPPTRTYGALPDNSTTLALLQQQGVGTQQRDFNRSHVSVEYLHEHGSCMDYLVAQPSTMAVAGRGAFAARALSKDSVVAPVPLIHVPHRSALSIYPGAGGRRPGRHATDAPMHEQLLVNYCFGHAASTLLLCPYGVVSSLVNHAPTVSAPNATTLPTANVKIVWSTKLSAHLEWREQPISEWGYSYQTGLGFEYIALRDIAPGEEIFVDYGTQWQAAWDAHVATWQPVPRLVDQLNEHNSVIPTTEEWSWSMGDPNVNPNAVNLWCWSLYRELQGLKAGLHDAYPCKVVLRMGDTPETTVYTAEVVYRQQLVDSESEQCVEYFDEVLWSLPRDAFSYGGVYERFDTREYAKPGTFRHPLGIPDELMPDVWKNIEVNRTIAERRAE